jgi:ferredoxin-NADP reductase
MNTYIVTEVIQETPDITTIRFVDASGAHPDFEPGQYVTVHFADLDVPEGKAYSLSSIPSDPYMSITVKAIGTYSRRICSLVPGDKIHVSQPYGFLYNEEQKNLVCIAGGVGISPLWSIMRSVLKDNPTRKVKLLYSNKTLQDIALHGEITKLTDRHESLKVAHHVTRHDGKLPAAHYFSGRIDTETIKKHLEDEAQFLLCGSVDFVTGLYKNLRDLEVPESSIATETFFGT